MPELAEVKITSEFVEKISSGKTYTHLEKSSITKVKTDLLVFENDTFTISSIARGKEFKIVFTNTRTKETRELLMFLGMSGAFVNLRHNAPEKTREKFLKHGHLRIHATDGSILVFYDVRRFGKWKWLPNNTWSKDRGPCPLTEYSEFSQRVLENYRTHKDFKAPIHRILMSQYWFNGIGNYLRAEIIQRVEGVSPWISFNQLSEEQVTQILKQCHECPRIAYQLQGGQLKDWVNPFNEKENSEAPINSWIKVYGMKNMSWMTDKNGRRFWFEPKWNETLPAEAYHLKLLLAK
jgi:formamidopyrimidine-DNA glycosylase